jgi:hypothetical protein
MAEIAASLSQSRLKRSGFDSKPIWSVGTQLSPELSEDAAWESRISFQHRLKWTWSPVLIYRRRLSLNKLFPECRPSARELSASRKPDTAVRRKV